MVSGVAFDSNYGCSYKWATGKGYQSRISRVLESYVEAKTKKAI